MTTLNDNTLHGDPGIEAHALHHEIPVSSEGATPMQRDRATTIFEKGAAGRRAFVAPKLETAVPYLNFAPLQNAIARLKRAASDYEKVAPTAGSPAAAAARGSPRRPAYGTASGPAAPD